MFDLQHELSKINLKDAKVTIPRDVYSNIIGLSAIAREKLKSIGVAYDVFDDYMERLNKKDKQRANEYDRLVQEAEQILMSGNELTKDMEDKIREESKWYNREILHIN